MVETTNIPEGFEQTDIGIVPIDWDVNELEKVGRIIDGDRGVNYPSRNEFSDSGYCLFLSAKNVTKEGFDFSECIFITKEKDNLLNQGKLVKRDVVLTTRGTVGNFAFFSEFIPFENIRINSGMVILRNEKADLETTYLYRVLQSRLVQDQIDRIVFGSAQPQLTVKGIAHFQIPIPPTVEEQQAIATALSDVDALISVLDKLIAKKRDIKQGAMQQLLTGKKRLPGFSGEWEVKKLEEITDCLDNLRIPLNETQRSRMKGDCPYCGANGILDYVNDYVIDDSIILMAEDGGYFDEYAHRPIAYRMSGKCWVNNHAHILKAKEHVDQDYVFYSLVHKNILRFLASGTRAKLNKSEMYKIEIDIPQTKAEQTAIAAILSDMDAEITALERKRDKTRALKQGMMQELLTGRIRLT